MKIEEIIEQLTRVRPEVLDEDGLELYNFVMNRLDYIKILENKLEAAEMVHNYDIRMIDDVKGEAVRLYKEIEKKDKIIDGMAKEIAESVEILGEYCDEEKSCKREYEEYEECAKCIIKYFEREVENEN